MAIHRMPAEQRRIDYAKWRAGMRRRIVDPLAGPRGLAIGLSVAVILWVVIAAVLGAF